MNVSNDRSIAQLEAYLEAWRARLKRLRYARAAAAIAAAVLLVTVIGVYFAMHQGFTAWVVNTARAVLLLAIVSLVLWLLVWPLRKLKSALTHEIETRAPQFDGRLDAFLRAREQRNPLTGVLAEDTLKVAEAHAAEPTIKPRDVQLPWIVAAASVITLLWLGLSGPGLWSYGTRYLWVGWAVPNLKPAQSIAVKPGDQAVRRGGNVPLLATMQGFAPSEAEVHVQLSDGQWQQVPMTRTDAGFAFTFFSVREPIKYYVASSGVRSPDYNVSVIDLPNIDHLKLTYTFPQWTGRKPEVQDPGGDVAALKGTHVEVEFTADGPLPKTELVLDKSTQAVNTDAQFGKTAFDVNEDGRYYLAARVGNEQVRLSDDYFIRVIQDGKPEVHIQRPGRDYGASSIEEVTARVDANDDFGLNALALHYSVNGGKWQTVNLPAQGQTAADDHTFALESLGDAKAPLKPGDVISYYAEAKDHSNTVRTDMFFIDVRPFDRRYSQSQESGGEGQGQGSQQGEISQRQREIIVSTWNLIREQADRSSDKEKIEDNSKLLAELETKLAAQASTLSQRMQARDIDSSDAQSKEFSDNIKQAIAAMQPAAKRLNSVELDEAIQPEQQALQYILRAESVFNDIQVQQQRSAQAGGAGGAARDSRDLAQLYELEMDLNKNQYETKSNASPEQQNETNDELERKLQELARRQQQLANAAKQQQQLTQEQRWQQESLKREAEQLQRRLEQQQAANQQGQQQGAQQQGGQAGQGGASGTQSAQANANQTNELQQRLESAIRAMDESSQAMRSGSDANERSRAQRAAAEAQRQLNGASDALNRNRQQAQQQSLANLAEQSSRLYEQQAQFDRNLQDEVRKLRAQQDANNLADELTPEEKQLARDKRAIADKLQAMRRDMLSAQRDLKDASPQAAFDVASASQKLDENKVDQRIANAVRYIENGAAPFVVASESSVTDSLREVRDQLQRAASQTVGGAQREDKTGNAVAEVRALRQQLEQLTNQQQRGQSGSGAQSSSGQQGGASNSQANGQTNGRASSAGSQGGQASQGGEGNQGNAQANANAGTNAGAGSQSGSRATGANAANNGNAAWIGTSDANGPSVASNMPANFRNDVSNAIRDARAAINELNTRGRLSARDSQQLQDITRELEAARIGGGNARSANADSIQSLALLEQLELKLSQASERGNKGKQAVRSAASEPVPQDYEDAVAEYYRRLSKD